MTAESLSWLCVFLFVTLGGCILLCIYLFMQVCIYVSLICIYVCSFPRVSRPIYDELMHFYASAFTRRCVRLGACVCVCVAGYVFAPACQSHGRARLISAASCSLCDVG